MQITVCEGCGRTSLDADAHIEVLSIRARVNGNEESSFDGKIEACAVCRQRIHVELQRMTSPDGKLTVKAERVL